LRHKPPTRAGAPPFELADFELHAVQARSEALERLRARLDRYVVAVVGTGVSVAATNRDQLAAWGGLLINGINRCEQVVPDLPAGWGDKLRERMKSDDAAAMVGAADEITRRLQSLGGDEFARWLSETVGRLEVKAPAVLEAL